MKSIIGLMLIIVGLIAGCYVGIWIMFIGGISDIITAVQMSPIPPIDVAIGVAKFIFAWPAAWISFFILGGTGIALINSDT